MFNEKYKNGVKNLDRLISLKKINCKVGRSYAYLPEVKFSILDYTKNVIF